MVRGASASESGELCANSEGGGGNDVVLQFENHQILQTSTRTHIQMFIMRVGGEVCGEDSSKKNYQNVKNESR